MNNNRLLIIFVKNPELGKCKTRLAATIGDEKALQFYQQMLERTKEVATSANSQKAVYYSSFIDENDLWPNEVFSKHLQIKGELGIKMSQAFENSFKAGYTSVCIIGSDCYELDTKTINEAFKVLENKQAVIGPSTDGGYYLLGMNQLIPGVFENKEWSTATVSAETLNDFEQLNISYSKLKVLTDIDTEEDLKTIPEDKLKLMRVK
ncbi:TIGR04282 family arsenosugar biosynthesis glycosyltransferase [Marivirga sp. S37H4]|uniref:TIGR04282 family arsenosugar biosynthesis glycosyltransferase n=1 Tax=Marivirga aurantiaca TaxID=2802615 RepID=A0A934WV63_9BACT|nr:TIGR04282 family arsenosugar biosynthesis glycosyltransferase [Marivirga aurantiaca]MBK6263624.1 TIGR04282 family arsenosugar biosynthesis glycosyltransferase [Marivirga aurantiaca]